MNRTELATELSRRTSLPPATTTAVLDAFAETMRDCAATGERLTLPGTLTLERVERPARTGRHPRTGEPLDIPASFGVRLTAGTALKAAAKEAR